MDRQKMIQFAITIAIMAVVLALRGRSMMRLRPLRLETLWIVPALYAAVVIGLLVVHPPSPAGWLWTVAAGLVGAVIGWWRGSMISVHVNPETHALDHRSSPAAFIVIAALVVLRNALRESEWAGIPAIGLDGVAIGDALLALGCSLIALTRIELFLRARRMLAAARLVRDTRDPFAKG